jgi:dinuclear metal center YbgI/SA1388 family protein
MITKQELYKNFNTILEPERFKDYGFNGMQVEGKEEIMHLATAVSASLDSIKKAVEWGADALFVHHGLFWKGDSFEIKGSLKSRLELLLKANISLFAYHLPLDAHTTFGNNWKAAKDLGWQDLKPCCAVEGEPIGVIGTFIPRTKEQFKKEIELYYSHGATVAFGGSEYISSSMLISGGGYKYLVEAKNSGVDCLITGNFDEPAWNFSYEENINFMALGHTATEEVGPKAIAEYCQSNFKIKTKFLPSNNPF